MVFSTPGIDITAGQEEWVVRWRIARPRKRRWAMVGDFPREDIRVDHETDGVLSQWMTDRLWRTSTRRSKTIWCSTTPACSRSELVIVPIGFESDTTFRVMSLGHSTRQTVGGTGSRPLNHTPPTPNALASTYPT
jgi:hypothetical protein